ncbi:SMP-30/gluconolactonase/LRE family protein [Glaciihabitans sp. INWT7]|uniref:SMP-30/gluconolactonase/LRE family protein n=1 Tax=Glaciihabitans sp. INWT7 TaxID=2596912 RepID=UPI001629B7BF|nr:SMP-30/gluconolactonase/LRE family protein [Glaciihabitans sp. INWT7]QNE45570.1 SMP-30/gluconolactonase/LRE family protein [Glaciihabitans sp. INWT7]
MKVVRGLPRVFRDASAILAESIVWDPDGFVLWCDITAGLLYRCPIDGLDDTVIELPPPLASFAPTASGNGYVASLGDRVVRVDATGGVRDLAQIEHAHDGLRLNEGKCDPYGRWITGSMNLATGEPDGALYSVADNGAVRVLRGGFGVANGFEWSLDDTEMFFTDTAVKTIYRAPYSETGDIGEVKVFHSGESHDGLTIDAEGFLWGGIYGGGRVVRYSPEGIEDLVVELPAPNITSVAFGGPGMSTLFVGSARENLTEEQLEAHPLSGSIFAIETATNGRPARRFGA